MDLFSSDSGNFPNEVTLPSTIIESKIHETFKFKRIITEDAGAMLLEAEKTVQGRRVAVAVLSPGFKVVSRKILAVDHPNIVKAHQIIKQENGSEAVVMDHPDGNPLPVLFRHGTLFSVEQSVALVLQLLSAFHAVHKRGEAIRTIIGNNIFIEEELQGRLRLKLVNCGIGTAGLDLRDPNYLSPEQVMDSSSATPLSDVWSAGAFFFHLLFGRPLFEGKTPLEIAQKIMLEDPVIDPRGGAVPEALIEVVGKALDRNEHDRFSDIPAMVAALLPFRAASVSESTKSFPPPRDEQTVPDSLMPSSSPSEREDNTEPDALADMEQRQEMFAAEFDWAEAPTVPPDDPIADPNAKTNEVESNYLREVEAETTSEPQHTAVIAESAPSPAAPPRETLAEIPRAIKAENQARPHPQAAVPLVPAPSEEQTDDLDSATLIAPNRDNPSVVDGTRIDDLAGPTQSLQRKAPPNPSPAAELKDALKKAKKSEARDAATTDDHPKGGTRDMLRRRVGNQPALATALGVFSLVFIAFIVLLASVLRNPSSIRGQRATRRTLIPPEDDIVAPEKTEKAADPRTERQVQPKAPAPPETVVIDLLRVPAEAKILVNNAPSTTPLHLLKSQTAVKLTIRARGFKPYERLIVPDRNRKMVVKMEAR